MGKRARGLLIAGCALALVALFAANAWVGEDAHITMRTVDNFVHGHGLRWNVDERVQTYTHPLWMLCALPLYALTREIPTTLTALGAALSTGAYVVLATRLARRSPWAPLAIAVLFAGSTSLVRYSTSGFENPLTFFLLALFATEVLRERTGVRWGRIALLAALLATNRLDAALLVAPALALLVLGRWRAVAWRRVALGALPLVVWLAFALVYYGFATPNTAHAKLSATVERSEYLRAGARYLADLPSSDPVGALLLLVGTVLTLEALVAASRPARSDGDDPSGGGTDRAAAGAAGLGLGALAYVAYVLWIGGDFLAGRFLSAPILLALVVSVARARPAAARLAAAGTGTRIVCAAGVATLAGGLWLAAGRIVETVDITVYRRPEAHLYLEDGEWKPTPRARAFRRKGREARESALERGGRAEVLSVIGMAGLAAGPEVVLVDRFALTDPLLARLPAAKPETLRPGHVARALPEGYLEARDTGDTSGMHPSLAEYWTRLRLVTAGPLLDGERLATIVRFHLGRYDHLLAEYAASE